MSWGSGGCPSRDDEIVRKGGTCPPKPEEVLLPVLGIYFALTLIVIGQHLVELRFDRIPVNAWGDLDDFAHLAGKDKVVVAQFAEDERILYADYQRKLGRHKSFLFLLALVSGAVLYAIFYQERMGSSAWVTTLGFSLTIVALVIHKALAKTALYILTDQQAVVIAPKYLDAFGHKFRFFLPHQMHEILLKRGDGGIGSVWFSTEELASGSYAELNGRAPLNTPEEHIVHLGFNDILRSEEVWELVANWRASSLGSSPPPDIIEAPEPPVTWAGRIQRIVVFAVLAVFATLFAIISFQSDDNGAYMWYVYVSIPYGIIWGACGLVYLYARYKEYTRASRGFVRLATSAPSGSQGGLSFSGGFITAGPGSSSGSEVDLIGFPLRDQSNSDDQDDAHAHAHAHAHAQDADNQSSSSGSDVNLI